MSETETTSQKVILITGCSSGIGLETAIECSKNDMRVFACVRNPNKAFELKKRIEDENLTDLTIIEMDVSNDISIKNGINQILNFTDHIDILFNNAGRMILGSLEDLTDSELTGQINTDLRGVIILTKNIIPVMRKNNSGLIINMSSVAGRIGFPLSTAYCISKFGIEGLSQALRRELVLRNINVCLIEAGIVNTKFFSNTPDAIASKHSVYADETKVMRKMIDNIQKEKFSQASDVSKEI